MALWKRPPIIELRSSARHAEKTALLPEFDMSGVYAFLAAHSSAV
jgi:hypothetical protein